MAERIHELLPCGNLQEVFGEGDPTKRRAPPSKNSTPMTVCCMSPQAPLLGTLPSINLQVI